ncbi:MAG: hypothetical protein ABL898_01895 [Hyphomicrobiaceae bacterium]
MVLATVVIAVWHLAPRMATTRIVYDVAPDFPVGFGYKMAWLAVRTRDTMAVVDALGVLDAEPANWKSGLGTVYDDKLGETRVFISPPVNGWTFVVGLPLPAPVGRRFTDKSIPFLLDLGSRFIEVQYFFSYPIIDYYAWARVIGGKVARAFAISDDGVVWNKGRPTKEEKALGLKLFEFRGIRGRKGDAGGEMMLYPTEEHVIEVASKWSIDPTSLERMPASEGLGVIARAPSSWRAERISKAA